MRLEANEIDVFVPAYPEFLFQTGAIRSLPAETTQVVYYKFLFQTGAIRRSRSLLILFSLLLFLFQTGAIRSDITRTKSNVR